MEGMGEGVFIAVIISQLSSPETENADPPQICLSVDLRAWARETIGRGGWFENLRFL